MLLPSSSGSCSFQALEAAGMATGLSGRGELIGLWTINRVISIRCCYGHVCSDTGDL